MKVYYAHPMSWYGTQDEATDLEVIAQSFPAGTEIVNPATIDLTRVIIERDKEPQTITLSGAEAMAAFLDLVRSADAIVYRTFKDDAIGAGVAQEILTAFIHGKQVFRMWDQVKQGRGPKMFEEQFLRASFGPRLLTIVETRDRIKRGVM